MGFKKYVSEALELREQMQYVCEGVLKNGPEGQFCKTPFIINISDEERILGPFGGRKLCRDCRKRVTQKMLVE